MSVGKDINFGDWLRGLRGEKTQGAFAAELGVDQSYLARIERGERPPTEMLCIRIARTTGEKLATVLEVAGFAERGEFDDNITDEEHEIHRRLARFKSSAARTRAIQAAIAVIESLSETDKKD